MTTNHAERLSRYCAKSFGWGNEFAQKITYREARPGRRYLALAA